MERVLHNPEIQAIVSDPRVQEILTRMLADPTYVVTLQSEPELIHKIEKLVQVSWRKRCHVCEWDRTDVVISEHVGMYMDVWCWMGP